METNTYNSYLFKALDAYPYSLEEAMEALNYSLSYQPDCAQSLHLMGKIYGYRLRDFKAAQFYYEAAMASELDFVALYPDYIYALIQTGDLVAANKAIDFARSLQGSDQAYLDILTAMSHERNGAIKEALKAFKLAAKSSLMEDQTSYIEREIERVKKKLGNKKKKNKKPKKKGDKKRRS